MLLKTKTSNGPRVLLSANAALNFIVIPPFCKKKEDFKNMYIPDNYIGCWNYHFKFLKTLLLRFKL